MRNGKTGAERMKAKKEISYFSVMILTEFEGHHCFWKKKKSQYEIQWKQNIIIIKVLIDSFYASIRQV